MARLSPSQEDIYAVSRLHAHVTTWFRNNWAGNWQHHGAHFTGFEKIHNKSSFFEDVKEEIDKRLIRKYGLTAANKKAISTDSIRRFLLLNKNSFDNKVMDAFLGLTDTGLPWSEYRERVLTPKTVPAHPMRLWQIATAVMLVLCLAAGGWYLGKQGNTGDLNFSAEVSSSEGFPKTIRIFYNLENMHYKIAQVFIDHEKVNLENIKGELTFHSFIPKKANIKLFLDGQAVKELTVTVPSDGWYGSINNKIPLQKEFFLQNGILQYVITDAMRRTREEPYVSFMQFREFGIDADKLKVSCEVINNEKLGGIWAYDVSVDILGTQGSMTFNLLSPDAVIYSRLKVADTDLSVEDRSYALSRLGVRLDDWSALEVITKNNTFRISLNGKVLVNEDYEGKLGQLAGIQFYMKGSGAVRNVHLQEHGKKIISP